MPQGSSAVRPTKQPFYTIWLSAEAIDLGRPFWILHPISCHTPEAVTTVFKCSWGWTQKASETCRVLFHLLINILSSCIMLVFLYILTYDAHIQLNELLPTTHNTRHTTQQPINPRHQPASIIARVLLQLLINILPSCITLVLYIYIYIYIYYISGLWMAWPIISNYFCTSPSIPILLKIISFQKLSPFPSSSGADKKKESCSAGSINMVTFYCGSYKENWSKE